MFKVYYTVPDCVLPDTQNVQGVEFNQLNDALLFCERLRTRRRNGEAISYITLCSENPDSVGQPGVADVGPDYDWKKRRP